MGSKSQKAVFSTKFVMLFILCTLCLCNRYTQHMELTNTGAIPLDFCWHMADETAYTARDFTVLPATGTVLPRAKQLIQVDFQPQSVQHYNLSLVMDIPGVTSAAARLGVKGECAVPIIRLAEGNELLQFGQVFVHYPYSQTFTLINDSKLPAKFEVLSQVSLGQAGCGACTRHLASGAVPAIACIQWPCSTYSLLAATSGLLGSWASRMNGFLTELLVLNMYLPLQDQASQSLGNFTAVPAAGTIAAKGSKVVTLNLEASRLGRIQLPVYIRVAGSRNKPLQLVADAKAMGPWLEFAVVPAPALVDSSTLGPAADASSAGTILPEPSGADLSTAGGTSSTEPAAGATRLDAGCSSSGALPAEASTASHMTSASGTSRRAGRKGKGPKAPAAPQWAAAASLSFDKVQVLQLHTQQLLLRNPTLIDSEVKLFVEGKGSVFEVGRPVLLAVVLMQLAHSQHHDNLA